MPTTTTVGVTSGVPDYMASLIDKVLIGKTDEEMGGTDPDPIK